MVHFIFLQNNSHLKESHKLVSQFLDHQNQRYDFCKNSSNINQQRRKRETDRETPRVNKPHMSVTRGQRCDLTTGDLVDGEVSAMAKGTIVLPTPFRIERYPKP